jgi:hypothetical protein
MSTITNKKALWPSPELLEKLREKLHERILREELEYLWRLEAMDRLITFSQVDPATFHRLWIEPLLAAGASLGVAIACIANSHFQPN